MLLLRVVPCLMASIPTCAIIVLGINVAAEIGSIFNISLVSSTWITGHSHHGEFFSLLTAALSRNLQLLKPAFTILRDVKSKFLLLLIRGTHSIKDTLTTAIRTVVPFHHSVYMMVG